MSRPRIIPALLLRKTGLVKGEKFANHRYVGDAINTARIFNDKGVDELMLLDIDATREKNASRITHSSSSSPANVSCRWPMAVASPTSRRWKNSTASAVKKSA